MTQRNASAEVVVHDSDGATAVVAVTGDLDVVNADEVRSALLAAQGRYRSVTLDLGRVAFIDSSGLGIIVGAATRAERSGDTFHLTSPCKPVMRTLEMFGLHRLVAL